MNKTYDVIFIGGGVMGCSSAFQLAKRGLKVAVVEKGTVGEGPTGHSSAILRTHYSNPLTARMAKYGLEFYRDFQAQVGDECGFHKTGFLMLVAEEDSKGLEANLAMQRGLGINTELLRSAEFQSLMPGLDLRSTTAPVVAAYEPDSGYADGYLAVTSLARAAKKLGVDFLQETEVQGIRLDSGRMVGVDTSGGPLDAPRVVNTAGAWGSRVARMAGIDVPINACRIQVAFFRRPDEEHGSHPVIADFVHSSYFRPDTGNLTLAGLIDPDEANAVVDPDDFAKKIDFQFQADIGARICRRYPAMESSESTGGYASIYAITPDWHPVIDELPTGSGFYVCSGFSGHGFKLAPAVGVMVADLLTEVSQPEFDANQFRFSRFEQGEPLGSDYKHSIIG